MINRIVTHKQVDKTLLWAYTRFTTRMAKINKVANRKHDVPRHRGGRE